MNKVKQIILGSSSPRRAEILKGANISFTIIKPDVEEDFSKNTPFNEVAQYLSDLKSLWFKERIKPHQIVITADTIVVNNGIILGKPSDKKEAFQMIQSLSGKAHDVITGVTILSNLKKEAFSDTTKVFFKELTDQEINFYIDNYQPFDKAGAYGIQEWIGMIAIEKIEGSYFNVMGLPIHKVYATLKDKFDY